MKCWHCQSDLIWGGDHDFEEDSDGEYDILTNLSCPTCNTYVEVYHKFGEKDNEKKEEQLYGKVVSDDLKTTQ